MNDYAAVGLDVARGGAVVTITLNRPDVRNAQTPSMWRALAEIGSTLDEAVRVVVIRGAGDVFSAGLDRRMMTPEGIEGEVSFAEMAASAEATFHAKVAEYQQGFSWQRDPRIVTIAAVHGYAIGAGFQLALACDLRIIADDTQLSMMETALGMVPDLGGTKPLVEAVGYARALEICATSRMVSATEAYALGLANVVVPRADLDDTVASMTEALLAPGAGAVRDLKGVLQSAHDLDYDDQLIRERSAQHRRFADLARLLGG